MEARAFERDGKYFLISPLTPITVQMEELEEMAFAQEVKKMAPNPNLLWLQGRYVEAETANQNRQMWRAGDIAMKRLQPMFMPVTIMHDYRTAVGLVADTKLVLPDEASSVTLSRIDTTLGIWGHRFPEVAEEVDINYKAGTLMQSMECTSPHYECSVCNKLFHKLPGGAEREQWCDHLLGNGSAEAARILGGVTFTGSGLIFGTRGAKGALDTAHLDVFEDEVAEYHEKAHKDTGKPRPRRKTSMENMEIDPREFAELQSRPTKDALATAEQRATDAENAKSELEGKLEAEEAKSKKLEDDLKEANDKIEAGEEEARKTELRDGRLDKLGAGFLDKLPETAKARIKVQAGEMSDEDWTARLEELSELVGVKPDEGKKATPGKKGEAEFSKEEIASAGVGGGSGAGGGAGDDEPVEQTEATRRSAVSKLMA